MQVQLNPGEHVSGRESLAERATEIVEQALDRFADHITRVEVHLSDENAVKGSAADKRCAMEARLAGHPPVAVTHHAPTLRDAMVGAAEKLQRAVEHTLGRREHRR